MGGLKSMEYCIRVRDSGADLQDWRLICDLSASNISIGST